MQFPLTKIHALLLLIFATGESAWAQSTSANLADLTIGDFNATINKRVFHAVDKTHFTAPRYPMERPTKFTDLTIGDVRAIIIKREFPTVDKTHYITPKYIKKQALHSPLDFNPERTSQEFRLTLPSPAHDSRAPLLSSPLLRNRSATSSQTNPSPRNIPDIGFPYGQKSQLKADPKLIHLWPELIATQGKPAKKENPIKQPGRNKTKNINVCE